jgi:hypothetical protein
VVEAFIAEWNDLRAGLAPATRRKPRTGRNAVGTGDLWTNVRQRTQGTSARDRCRGMATILAIAMHSPHHGGAHVSGSPSMSVAAVAVGVLLLAGLWAATRYLPRVKPQPEPTGDRPAPRLGDLGYPPYVGQAGRAGTRRLPVER